MSQLNQNHLIFGTVPVMDRPLLDRLAPVKAAGFDGISIMPADIWALEEQGIAPEEVAQHITDAGLMICEVDCVATWLPAHHSMTIADPIFQALRESHGVDRVIETAARIGARSVAVIEIFGHHPSVDEGAEAFAALCDKAAQYGLKAHVEFAPFGGIPNLRTAQAIVSGAGRANGGMTIDSWHLFRSGSSLAELAAVPAEQIHMVQINDGAAEPWPDAFEETMNGRLLPGEGSFDLSGFLQTLQQMGSTAPIEVEVFNPRQNSMKLQDIARDWHSAIRQSITRAQKDQ